MGKLLVERGYTALGVYSRTTAHASFLAEQLNAKLYNHPAEAAAEAQLVFVTTTDREIGGVAGIIARKGVCRPGQIFIHTSGALASDIMQSVRQEGSRAISIHPLQAFSDADSAKVNLPGSCFAIEGDKDAIPVALELVNDLQGRYFIIKPEDKPLYHAAAVVASNYLVSLIHLSTTIYKNLGLSEEQSLEALLPLIQGTINNIAKSGSAGALTGPVARGDGATLMGHLKALSQMDWRVQEAYRSLGQYTVGVAVENGNITQNEGTALSNIFMEVNNREQKGNYCRLPAYEAGRQPNSHANRLRLSDGYVGRRFRYRRHSGGGLLR
ncbi:hypothetical protein N752_22720 [Desulforamulus aquiferis]|nr:DUF2520 domain-containing protein [Desulforamulus aquiferis]RYD02831.1 hypothetical protein N752_22720 [Desulforamulus aquiferis]